MRKDDDFGDYFQIDLNQLIDDTTWYTDDNDFLTKVFDGIDQ